MTLTASHSMGQKGLLRSSGLCMRPNRGSGAISSVEKSLQALFTLLKCFRLGVGPFYVSLCCCSLTHDLTVTYDTKT